MTRKTLFGTDGLRGRVGQEPMTPETILRYGNAITRTTRTGGKRPRILIAKDTRRSGYMFESALESGCTAAGADLYLGHVLPTPAVIMLTIALGFDKGIAITASHNPCEDNGIKCVGRDGYKLSDAEEEEVSRLMAQPAVVSGVTGKAYSRDYDRRYVDLCRQVAPEDFRLPSDLKIVVDCANGAMYKVAPMLLRKLGGQVIPIHPGEGAVPTGLDINRDCGATCEATISKAVRDLNADIGIAFDGDGDRVLMCDERGNVCSGDELLYIIASSLQQRGQWHGGVVGTVMSNTGLERALTARKIEFLRTPVGDRHILEKLRETGWILGGEPSGHIIKKTTGLKTAQHQFDITVGCGLMTALLLLVICVETKTPFSELRRSLRLFPQVNAKVPGRHESAALEERIENLRRTLGNSGRIICRPSGTEDVTRIMVEHESEDEANRLLTHLTSLVQQDMAA